VLAALLALAAAACSGSDAEDAPPTTIPTSMTADPRAGWRTPVTLPVTPVPPPEHTIIDPSFDALPGARAFFGTDDSDPAPHGYQIELPDDWNGDLVLFAHGFRGYTPELTVQAPIIREHLIQNGYAWAASSYAENGYRPAIGARDTARLLPLFENLVGAPERVYLYGQSMGGNVTTLSLEGAQTRDLYDGAVSECGVMTASGIVDYLLSWGALAGYLSDTDITTPATDAGELLATIREEVAPVLGPPDDPTERGETMKNAVLHLTGGPRPSFDEGYEGQYQNNFATLFGAVLNPSPGNAVAQNADTVYQVDDGLAATSDEINRGITRVQSNPDFQDPELYPEFAPATGDIGVPLLTIHGTGDLFVPIHLEQQYRRLVEAAGNGDLLVQRAIARAGHCMFSYAERTRAFDDLVAWVETGVAPPGDNLLGELTNVGATFTVD
jgi:pimeloyl-ACP methyl ester carboxylesterase